MTAAAASESRLTERITCEAGAIPADANRIVLCLHGCPLIDARLRDSSSRPDSGVVELPFFAPGSGIPVDFWPFTEMVSVTLMQDQHCLSVLVWPKLGLHLSPKMQVDPLLTITAADGQQMRIRAEPGRCFHYDDKTLVIQMDLRAA